MKIFLSHSTEDYSAAKLIAKKLKRSGIRCFVYEKEPTYGKPIPDTIKVEIAKSDIFGVLLSRHAVNSSWVARELGYAFGVKVGIALTRNGNLVVGARSFPGNPYDGHTLNEQMEQAGILIQETGVQPAEAYVDLGYRGVDKENPATGIRHRGKKGSLTTEQIA